MKTAFSTVACLEASAEQILKVCRKFQLDGVEIRMGLDNSILGKKEAEDIQKIRDEFNQSGIVVTDLGSGICINAYEESTLSKGRETIEYAAILGTKGIRVFLGNFAAKKNPDLPVCEYKGIVKQLQELCALAKQYDIEIWVETHNEFATGKILKQLIEDVGQENLKILWDIMHPLEDGEGVEETWQYIGDKVAHVHIKDGFDRQDPEWHDYQYTLLGEGALPIGGILDLLNAVGYEGYISFEWESQWRQELKEYDNSLEWVISQYTDYLRAWKQNPVPMLGEKWEKMDAPGRKDFSGFTEGNLCVETCIDNQRPYASCKRYRIDTEVFPYKEYRISVPYREWNTTSKNTAYGLISLFCEDGGTSRRIYMEKSKCGRLEYRFKTKNETSLKIELGIKGYGKVMWYRPHLQEVPPSDERLGAGKKVKLAPIFLSVYPITYKDNLQRMGNAFDRAASQGVDLVAFAETMNTRGVTDLKYEDSFETIDGVFCTMMREKAAKYGCYAFFSFRELDEYGARRNTAVLVGRKGEIIGKYHKSHLTVVEFENGMVPGNSYPVFETDFGKVGMLICYDSYYPEPAKEMALKGARFLLVSTAGNPPFRHIVRAKENGAYLVVACPGDEVDYDILSTKVVDPCGNILAQTNQEGEAAVACIDPEEDKYIYWLSVGEADAIPENIYRHEYRDDMR